MGCVQDDPAASPPVQSVAHLDRHQHGQSHRGRVSGLEDFAVNSFKDGVVLGAPHEVPLPAQETARKKLVVGEGREGEEGGQCFGAAGEPYQGCQ